ncbi:MAG TPA: tetratricopeptide repeat protein, partial [bacterium]|nr:tetratricopeptide repeat protein [bacterium]
QQYTHAIRDYTIAINLNDQSLWPYIGLARVYLKQKQYKHAKEILQMGQEQLPLNGALDFYLGHVANATKQPELAVQHYTDAQEHAYPRADKIHYYRGLVYQNQLKDHAQAKQDFESFLKSNTTDTAQIAEVKQHLQSL